MALSLCLLVTEVVLTRLFSVALWYHFAFLAISVALFGTGLAALVLHLAQRRLAGRGTEELLALVSLGLGVTLGLALLVLLGLPPDPDQPAQFSLPKLLVIFVCGAAPFFAGGFAVALAMARFGAAAERLYFWDLLGAGFGCLLVIPALGALGGPLALLAAAAVAAAAGAIFARGAPPRRRRALSAASALVTLVILLAVALNPRTGLYDLRYAKGVRLRDLGLELNRWNSFSLVSVYPQRGFKGWGLSPAYRGPIPDQKTLVIDMNAATMLTRFDGDLEAARFILHDLTAFVHQVRPRAPAVCVIGAGGGRDVLAALAAGAGHVTAVEIDPLIVEDVMRGRFREHTGRLYDRPDVTVVVDDGRQFIRRAGTFDIVHLSMVDTSAATAAGAYALSENSLYTTEAFRDFLVHLKPGGILSVSSVSLPVAAVGQRLAALARAALEGLGHDPAARVIVLTTPWLALPDATLYTVLVKRDPFTPAELRTAAEAVLRLQFQVAYAPGLPPRASDQRADWTATILATPDSAALRERMRRWPLDVSASTDDRPYFFYQNRLADLGAIRARTRRRTCGATASTSSPA